MRELPDEQTFIQLLDVNMFEAKYRCFKYRCLKCDETFVSVSKTYNCPYCKRSITGTIRKVVFNYDKSGKWIH